MGGHQLLPSLVEVTLYMDPIEKYGDPMKLQRLVEIPIAPARDQRREDGADGEQTNQQRPRTASAKGEDAE